MKNDLKYIGKNIRAARKNKNLTIETLSELIGISESFLGPLSAAILVLVLKRWLVFAMHLILVQIPLS